MELELNPRTTPFTLDHTLNCGQVFRWKKVDDEITDEQWMQSHIDSLREQASELELKIKNRSDIFETIEKLWGIEYHYSTLLWMLLQVLKDMNNVSRTQK